MLPLSAPIPDDEALQAQLSRDAPVEPLLRKRYDALQKAKAAGDAEAVQAITQGIREATGQLRTREATAGMGSGDKFLAGAGAGADRVARGALDVFSLGTKKHDPVADQDRKLAEQQLQSTDEGAAGDAAGEAGALAPVGLGVGSALRNLGAKAGQMGLGAASKLLSSAPVRAGAEGAAMGAVSADPGERGPAAAASGAVSAAIPLAGSALRRTFGTGLVKPTAAARLLRREGVDLTLGQMDPSGKIAQLEEASQSAPGFGRTLENQRAAAREGWQDAAMRKGVPPGGSLPPRTPSSTLPGRLDEMYKGFDPAYDAAVKGEQVYPATHGGAPTPLQTSSAGRSLGALDVAVSDPSVLATDQERAAVKKFLDDQLSVLPGGAARPPMLQKVPAEVLQSMRSNIRKAVREASAGGDLKSAKLLVNAERVVGEALDTQLKHPELLREADRQYARYKAVEGAQAAARDAPGGFTPAQLSRSATEGLGKSLRARGGGGDIRRLAAAGREVLDARVPATGARLATHALPAGIGAALFGSAGAAFGAAAGPSAMAGAMALANTRPVKNFLTGGTRPQRAYQMLESALRRELGPAGRKRAGDYAALAAALYGARRGEGEDQ